MENRVGDNVPSQSDLDALLATLKGVVDELKKFGITLQPEERAVTVKPFRGAELMVEKARELATRYEVTVKKVPLTGMMNDLRLAKVIQPFGSLLHLGAQLADDTALQAKSEYWKAFLAYYSALNAAAEHDAALASEMRELQDEMRAARKRRAQEDVEGADNTAETDA